MAREKSLKALLADRAELDAEIEAARKREMDKLRSRAQEMAAEIGMSVDDIFGAVKKAKVAKNGAKIVRFRSKLGDTWTGRGRKPGWARNMSKEQLEAYRV